MSTPRLGLKPRPSFDRKIRQIRIVPEQVVTSMLGWSFIASVTQLLTYFRCESFRLTGHDRPLEGGFVGLGWVRSLGRPRHHCRDANE